MGTSLFREKSLEKIQSPEDLNSYLRITNPSIWIAIIAVIILLAGTLVWSIFGKVETKVDAVAICDESKIVCYVSESSVSKVKVGNKVYIDGKTYDIVATTTKSYKAESVFENNEYVMSLGNYQSGENVYLFTINGKPEPGNYACEVVIETISPISFLFNGIN